METKENNLKVYLKEQMEEYHQECESIKALYADLLEHIEDCRDQIRQQKEREDHGFALLSPLAGHAGQDEMSAHLEGQIEAYERQKGKYQQQMRFYEEKTAEMQAQLDEFAHNEQLKAEWEQKLQAEQAVLRARGEQMIAADAENTYPAYAGMEEKNWVNDGHEDHGPKNEKSISAENACETETVQASAAAQETAAQETAACETAAQETAAQETAACETAAQETAACETAACETAAQETTAQETAARETAAPDEVLAEAVSAAVNEVIAREKNQLKDACSYMIRKLTEMKGYVQMDPMRCRVELERLVQYVRQLEVEAGVAGEQT